MENWESEDCYGESGESKKLSDSSSSTEEPARTSQTTTVEEVVVVSDVKESDASSLVEENETKNSQSSTMHQVGEEDDPLSDEGGEKTTCESEEDADASADDKSEGPAEDSATEKLGPLGFVRKGAVAALGGTMVGVGLVMIPLPTPFGAVVASSGLAVLGTEFDGAKEMNDKIIGSAKNHLESARDRVIQTIESMDGDDTKKDVDDSASSSTEGEEAIEATALDKEPVRFMNQMERERQESMATDDSDQTTPATSSWQLRRRAGAFLAKNLVPMLKAKNNSENEEDILPGPNIDNELPLGGADFCSANNDVQSLDVQRKDAGDDGCDRIQPSPQVE